ncbi:MAG TPA: TIGR02391 family protein [Terriglobales bacterium]|nr:TIGR02391 family protein [Terriglobales bacterium]
MTKWKRLFNAFAGWQNDKQLGNCVLMFIGRAMNPVQYTANRDLFASRRDELNVVLSFSGFTVGEDGRVRRASVAQNLDDAMERAHRLHSALASRKVHEDVLRFCRAELLDRNYFHAVFEAMKSIAAKIRTMSGLRSDGADLVQEAFSLGKNRSPVLAINSLKTETDEGEQRGFANLLVGLFGTIRNPLAHNPRLEWDMSEQDALDILTMASLVHRKLDRAYLYTKP